MKAADHPAQEPGQLGLVNPPTASQSNQLVALPPANERPISLDTLPFSLNSGESSVMQVEGTEYYVVDSTGTVDIRLDSRTSFVSHPRRTGRRLHRGFFRQIELKNNTANPITGTIAFGHDEFIDERGGT